MCVETSWDNLIAKLWPSMRDAEPFTSSWLVFLRCFHFDEGAAALLNYPINIVVVDLSAN